MSTVTTHVLDTSVGQPAAGVAVTLQQVRGSETTDVGHASTDADGRVRELGPERLPSGTYRLVFATGGYFAERGVDALYPQVVLDFVVADSAAHYHVPLLLAPYAYSTYRGS
ncbi:MAG: hydroxyisourate hydrolase [Candidatus Nanopelagicales bacterium]